MGDLALEVLTVVIIGAVGVLVGFFVRDPLKHWLERRRKIKTLTKQRIEIWVYQLLDPAAPATDFAQSVKEQNSEQNLFLFSVGYPDLKPSPEEIKALRQAEGKRAFIEKIGQVVARARGEKWEGLDKPLPGGCIKEPRDLVITDIPIPGYYYGWNSFDRKLLVISVASIKQFFPEDGEIPIGSFVATIAKRMAVFSSVPGLDPRATHSRWSVGCLFDFTIQLKRVTDVVARPYICPACASTIAKCCGTEFALDARKWVEGRPDAVPE